MCAVIEVHEENLSVGRMALCSSREEGYALAQKWVLEEIESREMAASLDATMLQEIDAEIRTNQCYCFMVESAGKCGKAVNIQIVETG